MAAGRKERFIDRSIELYHLQCRTAVQVVHIAVYAALAEQRPILSEEGIDLSRALLLALRDHGLPTVRSNGTSEKELHLTARL